MNRTWGYAALTLAGAWAFYSYAPSPEDESYFTRLVEYYTTPVAEWKRKNNRHLIQSVDKQEEVLFLTDTKRPDILRYRFPQ